MRYSLFAALFLSVVMNAQTVRIDVRGTTSTQALIHVVATNSDGSPFTGPCTYRISEGSSFKALVNDVNPALFAGSDVDTRPGSLVNGSERFFVAGTRTAARAADGKFASRALAADTTHWAGVTCGGSAETTTTFQTLNPPLGNLYPELPVFDANAPWNVAYPTMDWTDQSKRYIDPRTGLQFWRLTGPSADRAADPGLWTTWGPSGFNTPAIDTANTGTWSNLGNIGTNGASFATVAGGASDYAFIPFPQIDPAQGIHFDNFIAQNAVLVNVRVTVTCGNTTAGKSGQITLSLSTDSGQTGTANAYTINCPSGAPVSSTYPAEFPTSYFAGWGTTFARPDVGIPYGTANGAFSLTVNNSVATIANPAQGGLGFFNPRWAPGTKLIIDGTCCYTVGSVQSSSQLTLQEPLTAKANVSWSAAAFGVRISKNVNDGGTVDVSLGYAYAIARPIDAGPTTDADLAMISPNPVTVTKNADGSSLAQALTGYLYYAGGVNCVYLWIPYNSDGSVRAESRLISKLQLTDMSHIDAQGDTFSQGTPFVGDYSMFNTGDAKTALATYQTTRLFKAVYTDTLNGGICAGFPALNTVLAQPGVTGDCLQWTNVTPLSTSPPRDLRTQMVNAYHTGLNYAGETVGTPHPDFDLTYWVLSPYMQSDGGYTLATINPGGWNEAPAIFGEFDVTTGKLMRVDDSWSVYPYRFGRVHGAHAVQRWQSISGQAHVCVPADCSDSGTPSYPLNNDYRLPVIAVSRTDYGQAPSFSTNTSIDSSNMYGCPHVSDGVDPRWGTWIPASPDDKKCILVKVSSDACGHTPQTSYMFQDGKVGEQNEFPCPGYPSWTMLQPLAEGDWLIQLSQHNDTELFVVLKKTVNSNTDIDLWLLREASTNVLANQYGISNAAGIDSYPTHPVHTAPWSLATSTPFTTMAYLMYMKATDPAYTWYPANFNFAMFHGGQTFDALDRTTVLTRLNNLAVLSGPAPSVLLNSPTEFMTYDPQFAGSNSTYNTPTQGYTALLKPNAPANEVMKAGDFKHYNPSYGSGGEFPFSGLGSRTFSKVAGTNQIYVQTGTGISPGIDYKRVPLFGVAGPYWLQELSSAVPGNTLPDSGFGFCYAYNAGECRAGSSAGQIYFTTPFADTLVNPSNCTTDNWSVTAPCVTSAHPLGANVVEYDMSSVDFANQHMRKLGMAWNIPLRQYQFSNWRFTPSGDFMFGTGQNIDGVLSEFMAMKLPPWPLGPNLSLHRNDFVKVPVSLKTGPGMPYARARFGYAENGPSSSYFCTARQEACSTELPTAAPSDPYSFIGEARQNFDCASGCTVNIPAIPGRILYYSVDRLDASGNVVITQANAVAVP